MGMAAILFIDVEPFEQYALDRRLHVNSDENWLSGFREEDVQRLHDFKPVI